MGHGDLHFDQMPDRLGRRLHWAFLIGVILNSAFVVVEFAYGFSIESMALLADAGHNLQDVFALVLAWVAQMLSQRRSTEKRTYGFKRTTIHASLINSLFLVLIAGFIIWEAFNRFFSAHVMPSQTILIVAAIGVFVNGLSAWLFLSEQKDDLNVRSAYIHLLGDAAISAAVVVGALVMAWTGLFWIDSFLGILIGFSIVWTSWSLLRQSFNLSIDGVPQQIEFAKVLSFLRESSGVLGVHDLHIWSLSTREVALTAHLVISKDLDSRTLLANLSRNLETEFGIHHSTLQLEMSTDPKRDSEDCAFSEVCKPV